jgi:adenosylcobinamide-GDP ribazoletransferase
MLRQIKNLLAFLTALPFRMDMEYLADSAKLMWLFPFVGAFLGLLSGLFGWAISFFLPALVVGALTLAALLWLTGLHHADGLLDFGDAVMFHGSAERKIEIMHDQFTGAGAVGLGLMIYLVTAFTFVSLASYWGGFSFGLVRVPLLVSGLVVVESCAKLSMVVATWAGKAVHEGMNSPFMDAMHGRYGDVRLVVALALSLVVAVPLLLVAGFVTVVAAVLCGLVMVWVAHRNFGGVTGDVLGATNEISRMVCVVVLLAVLQWL